MRCLQKLVFQLFSITLCASITISYSARPVLAQGSITVQAGTAVILKLQDSISSKNSNTGDTALFSVVNDVKVNGKVVIKSGTMVQGQVQKAKKAGAVGAAGELVVSVHTVPAVDGTMIPVNLTKSAEGKAKLGTSIVLTILCCILFLLKKGEDVQMTAGSTFTAMSMAPVDVAIN